MKNNISPKAALLAGYFLMTGLIAPSLRAQGLSFTTVAGGSQGSVDGPNFAAQFYNPTGVAVDGTGNVYVADQNNNLIRKITPLGTNWIVTTIAGGTQGGLDGTNTSAQFFGPTGIAIDRPGNLYVADQYNGVVRKITQSGTNWVVSTIAGTAGLMGNQNGTNGGARFSNPTGLALDGAGNIFVADEVNNAIRRITPVGTNWIVTSIAGGAKGASDGTNTAAQFYEPFGVAVDTGGRVFVADQFNNTIRLITPVGTNWVVTTIVGQPVSGLSNGSGTNVYFDAPVGLAVDTNDNVYVADLFNNAVRKLAPSGTSWMVSTIGGGSQGSNNGTGSNASFDLPFGVAVDAYGDLYVADSQNNAIRLGVATNSPAPTGSLEVMLTPSRAISAGAKWRLDGVGLVHTNGAILSGLVPGNHSVSFLTATGFTAPAAQIVPVTVRQMSETTGNYTTAIANAGSLQVMISPSDAVLAGAQWQVDSGPWQTNEAIVQGLSSSVHHTLSFFNPVSGWTTPSSQTVALTNRQTTLATGFYVLQTGSMQTTILPSTAVAAGAKWQIDGGAFQASGATISGLLPGSHTVSYNTLLGWKAPVNEVVIITNALTTSAVGIYTQPPQLSGVIAAGGKFQFVLQGQGGTDYVIQDSLDLIHWTPLATNTLPEAGFATIMDSEMTNYVRRFYRALAVPITPPL
jgi:NHL repeat